MGGMLWGPRVDLDYWTAEARGLVGDPERRAVALLCQHTDPLRTGIYCLTGEIAAMGNVTKRLYLVRRGGGVVELDDGRPAASWCLHLREWHGMPPTDNVLARKNLIEGEELAFMRTANRSVWGSLGHKESEPPIGVRNLLAEPFVPDGAYDLPGANPRLIGTDLILDEGPATRRDHYEQDRRDGPFEEIPRLRIQGNGEVLHGPLRVGLVHFHRELENSRRLGNALLAGSRQCHYDDFLNFSTKNRNRAILGRPERPTARAINNSGSTANTWSWQVQGPNDPPGWQVRVDGGLAGQLGYEDEQLRREIEREVLRELQRPNPPEPRGYLDAGGQYIMAI